MKTLRVLTVSMVIAATAGWASAGEEASVPTFTVTAKRHPAAVAVEHVAPQSAIEFAMLLTGDMPEAQIDYRVSPVGVSPAPTVERVAL
jgi:hypothetical protein